MKPATAKQRASLYLTYIIQKSKKVRILKETLLNTSTLSCCLLLRLTSVSTPVLCFRGTALGFSPSGKAIMLVQISTVSTQSFTTYLCHQGEGSESVLTLYLGFLKKIY